MTRIFFGIPFPARALKVFTPLYNDIYTSHPKLTMVPPHKWHITLHFVGNVTPKAYEVLHERFLHTPLPSVKKLTIGGDTPLGAFGNRILYLRVEDTQHGLKALHGELFTLVPTHLTQKFNPHITWARNSGRISLPSLIEKHAPPLKVTHVPGQLILYESLPQGGKTIYIKKAIRMLN